MNLYWIYCRRSLFDAIGIRDISIYKQTIDELSTIGKYVVTGGIVHLS